MTSTRPVGRLGVHRGLHRLVVVVALLAGLLAMHGLGGHGAGHPQSHDAVDVTAAGEVHAGHLSNTAAASETDSGRSVGPLRPSPDISVLGICLAVLAGAVLLLAGRRLLRLAPVVSRRGSAVADAFVRAVFRRWRDPCGVCLRALSIQRC